ncbi:Phage major tail protein TP901-1 [uncultured Caudovirales phage]|uniref:Phage major tail protein TP901-1 n=1 Tax=uncultured Caudovirales phage TaxID=2100421 RepID=A0A6J7WFV0_9CAUD|nr:Phage major tail protein TP901-1 [uncultured Caudovirales phage]
MATTGVFNGTSLVVLIGTEVIGYATSCSLSLAIDTPDSSTKQSLGWAEEIGGQRSWSLTTDGLATVVPGSVATYISTAELNALAIARAAVTVKFTTVNNSTVDGVTPIVGDVAYSGSAFIESVDMTADMENPVTYSVSFKGTGVLTITTNA